MSTPWVRLWREMPTDPKWRVVAKRSGRPLAEVIALFPLMMAMADDDGAFSWSPDVAAAALDIDPEHASAIHAAMQGLVLDGSRMLGWAKRQPKREDSSTDRVREFRRRKRDETHGNAGETQCNAPDSDPEREEEVTPLPPEPDAARAGGSTSSDDGGGVGVERIASLQVGVGLGGEPSPEAKRKVCREHDLADAEPLVAVYRDWKGAKTARDPDAKFIASARTILAKRPEVRAACRPSLSSLSLNAEIAAAAAISAARVKAEQARFRRHAH